MTAPVVFGHLYLAPMLGELLHQFPQLSLDLTLTNRFVDLIEEGMDLAIRIGQLADSRLIARRLCTNHRVLVASPSYIERWGMPERPEDLARHQCVLFNGFPKPAEWKLVGPDGLVTVDVAGRVATNNVETLTARGQAGSRHHRRRDAVRRARRCCPASWCACSATTNSSRPPCSPSTRRRASCRPRSAPTVDFLVEKLSDPPIWDQPCAARSRASDARLTNPAPRPSVLVLVVVLVAAWSPTGQRHLAGHPQRARTSSGRLSMQVSSVSGAKWAL